MKQSLVVMDIVLATRDLNKREDLGPKCYEVDIKRILISLITPGPHIPRFVINVLTTAHAYEHKLHHISSLLQRSYRVFDRIAVSS